MPCQKDTLPLLSDSKLALACCKYYLIMMHLRMHRHYHRQILQPVPTKHRTQTSLPSLHDAPVASLE